VRALAVHAMTTAASLHLAKAWIGCVNILCVVVKNVA
jgi:hypothetical protein